MNLNSEQCGNGVDVSNSANPGVDIDKNSGIVPTLATRECYIMLLLSVL